jgi:hypothetical protein
MLGETTIHKTPSLCESVGNYKIEQYICGKYISDFYFFTKIILLSYTELKKDSLKRLICPSYCKCGIIGT